MPDTDEALPLGATDHDLLIDMRRMLIDVRADVRDSNRRSDKSDARVTAIELAMVKQPSGEAIASTVAEWTWFKGVGRFLWGALVTAFAAIISITVSLTIHYVLPQLGK